MTVIAAKSGYKVVRNRATNSAEIYVYGIIGGGGFFGGDGITAKQFADDLKAVGNVSKIDLRINSEGGDVFDGKAMYALLVEHPATVVCHIDGLAASAASFLAMAGNDIIISEGGFIMIHDAYGAAYGRAEDMRRTADLLDVVNQTIVDVYASRTKNDVKAIRKWMSAETWFTAAESVEKGFADSLTKNLKVAAKVSKVERYKNLPVALRPRRMAALAETAELRKTLRLVNPGAAGSA